MSVIVFFSRTYWASTREKVSAFRGCPRQAITGGSAIVEDVERIPLRDKIKGPACPLSAWMLCSSRLRLAFAADVLELRDCVRYYDGEPVRRFGLHSMRHGLATWLADRGVHPSVIQRMLRHSSPNVTMHYIHGDARRAQEEFVEELTPSAKSFIINGVKWKKGYCGSTICEAVDQLPYNQTDGRVAQLVEQCPFNP